MSEPFEFPEDSRQAPASSKADDADPRLNIAGLDRKRPRAAKACSRCHVRKVRCDAVQRGRPCTNCELDQHDCRMPTRKSIGISRPQDLACSVICPTELCGEDCGKHHINSKTIERNRTVLDTSLEVPAIDHILIPRNTDEASDSDEMDQSKSDNDQMFSKLLAEIVEIWILQRTPFCGCDGKSRRARTHKIDWLAKYPADTLARLCLLLLPPLPPELDCSTQNLYKPGSKLRLMDLSKLSAFFQMSGLDQPQSNPMTPPPDINFVNPACLTKTNDEFINFGAF